MVEVEVSKKNIIIMFSLAIILLTTIGYMIDINNVDSQVDDSRDCNICEPIIDKQIPTLVAFMKAASELPMTGLCSSCKVSFDSSNVRRVGNFCLIWKLDGNRVVNTFDLLVPKVNITCTCNSVLNAEISPPDELIEKFPCLNSIPSAISAMRSVNDLSLEALQICTSTVSQTFNSSNAIRNRPEAKLTLSIDNFRFRTEARLNRQRNIQSILIRLSHMSPENIKIFCEMGPAYSQICDCLQSENIRRLSFYSIKTMLPCMVQDTVMFDKYKMLRESMFCFPDKKVYLYKNPTGNF